MATPDPAALAELRAKASSAVAIEALWTGDTHGWFVELCAVVKGVAGYESRWLRSFSRGGDIRLFNGQVPPWPEATEAAEVGAKLASLLGLPFHFPAAAHPEEDCPHWWEVAESYPCGRCGVQLLQAQNCRWRGVCYHCCLALEREAKEAQWSAAERSAARCSICGNPAVGDTAARPRCSTCRDAYRTFACPGCGIQVTVQREDSEAETCSSCMTAKRLAALSEADRQSLREAAARHDLGAAMDLLQCGLYEARDALDAITNLEVVSSALRGRTPHAR